MNKKIGFVKSGSFSHINESVRVQLEEKFPDHDLVVWDVRSMVRRPIPSFLRSMVGMVSAYGVADLIRRRDPVDCFIQSPACFTLIRDQVRRRVSPSGFAFTLQTQSMWDASVPGVPHFVYTDNTHLARFQETGVDRGGFLGEWWLNLEQQIYQRADRIFTMSHNVGRSLIEDYGTAEDKVRCVFAGSNVEMPSSCSHDPTRYARKAILFVGVAWERKGGPELLEAFENLLRRHPDATLTIAGCQPRVRLPNCQVLGRLPLDQVAKLYEAASLFCLPTRNEPFGIAFVEAMHHSLPLIGTAIGAIPDFITPEENGLIVPVGDPAALAAALDRALSDPIALGRMGRRSLELARDRYTWGRVGERLREEIGGVTRRS